MQVGIDGGAPTSNGPTLGDTVAVETPGTAAQTVVYTPTSVDSGTVNLTTITSLITLASIESLTVNGDENNDVFSVVGTAGADSFAATPGPTTDSGTMQVNNLLGVTYQNLGATGSVTANGNGGTDAITVNGTNENDTFTVAPTTGAVTLNTDLPVKTTAIAGLVLNGNDGDDIFTLNAGLPYTTTLINGGNPSASDTLNLSGATAAVAVTLANSVLATDTTVTGFGGTVSLTGVEVANLALNSKTLSVAGSAGNDAITYTPTGAAAGTFQDAGLNTLFNFSGATGAAAGFTVTGAAGTSNALIVDGTSSADAITLAGNASTNSATVTNGGLQPVTIGANIPEPHGQWLGRQQYVDRQFQAGNPIPMPD